MSNSDVHPCAWSGCSNRPETTRRCSGCRKAWYCSTECQKHAWTLHIFDCKPDSRIAPGFHLAKACADDVVPVHPQTRMIYGFDRAATVNAEGYLLGLYQGLFIATGWKLEAREIDRWAKGGSLVDHIQRAFESYASPPFQGIYYPWFLQNRWILEKSSR